MGCNNSKIYHDLVVNKGPLGGVYSALNHAKFDKVFVIAGDLPFMDTNILSELNKFNSNSIVVPRWENGFVEPLCAIYSKTIVPIIQKQLKLEDLKINNLYKIIENNYSDSTDIKYISIDELVKSGKIKSNCFKNVNCLEDLESI